MSTQQGTPMAAAKRENAGKKKRAKTQSKGVPNYPRHSLNRALRIPKAMLDQNAGRECSIQDAAKFCQVSPGGEFQTEVSSAIKYGLLERPSPGRVSVTELAKKILRPQQDQDEVDGKREAVLRSPVISEVYTHYRGENLPDPPFLQNALVDTFKIPEEKVPDFITIFRETLEQAELLEAHGDKTRVVDASVDHANTTEDSPALKKLARSIKVESTDSCFVMMPFAEPIGRHYVEIFEPAIKNAGLTAIRADNDIFGTGKIMDQVWSGINTAKVLVAELTTRNPNVFYELGLAHALRKPVVLVSSNEKDVPFDLHHIRVIYYDVNDPFWGQKLIAKVAENVLSAIANPAEAIFTAPV
jgi:hypothetical protein